MPLLKDISPLHAEILEGAHDEHLQTLMQALEHRVKIATRQSGIRPGAIVTFVDDPHAGFLAGRQAKVIKVNKKTISVDVLGDDIPDWKRGYRVSPGLIAKDQ